MNLKNQINNFRYLAAKTSGGCALFNFFNTVFTRLNWKSKLGIPVGFQQKRGVPFYMRLGTTDWETFNVTFLLDEYKFVIDQVPKLKTIVDLGANIGDSARYFADSYPEARIVAIEPDSGNYKICAKNMERITPSGRVSIKQCFVGSYPGFAGVNRSQGEWGYSMDRATSAVERIPVVTMANLMQEFGFAEIDLLKCDIEGAEVELFQECSGWISRIRHLAIETCPPYSISILEQKLAASGIQFIKLHHGAPDGVHELALFRRSDIAP